MEIRFELNEPFDADLIARIEEKANGISRNLAARFLMRHWFEVERSLSLPPQRRIGDAATAEEGELDDPLETALGQIDEAW